MDPLSAPPEQIAFGEYAMWHSGASGDRVGYLPVYDDATGALVRLVCYERSKDGALWHRVPEDRLTRVPPERDRAYRDGRWIFTDTGEPEIRT